MRRPRHTRRGFTLTEILMAVGILGIGLAMVGAVFPVAVDQSRRSDEMTQSALAARSLVAMMRAYEDKLVPLITTKGCKTSGVPFLLNQDAQTIKPEWNMYNPYRFLYNSSIPGYQSSSQWKFGNYVAYAYCTPLNDLGPWRMTLVMYKAQGSDPYKEGVLTWNNAKDEIPKAGVGGYLLDNRARKGQAYMIDYVKGVELTPAVGTLADGQAQLDRTWLNFPDALTVYTTIVGD